MTIARTIGNHANTPNTTRKGSRKARVLRPSRVTSGDRSDAGARGRWTVSASVLVGSGRVSQ